MLFLFLETGMLGVFMALDLLIFFVFWEVGLVPMYFLINQWGSANRNYASLKFLIYTMGGSLGLLLAIQLLGVLFGTFDLLTLYERWNSLDPGAMLLGMSVQTVKTIAFWAFAIAFAIKVPVWPFHTWLPDAHTEAPTAGSMILAGVLLKLGAYGFLRLILPLYPDEARIFAGVLALLATAAIVFGALASYAQTDFKRLVAYSSVNHMGFVVLGIAAAALAAGTPDATIALNGAILQMFNHGLSAAGHVLPRRRDLRADTHARSRRVRRVVPACAGLWRHPDLHQHGVAWTARTKWLYLRVPGGARNMAHPDGLHSHLHAWLALYRRIYPERDQEGSARSLERTLGAW